MEGVQGDELLERILAGWPHRVLLAAKKLSQLVNPQLEEVLEDEQQVLDWLGGPLVIVIVIVIGIGVVDDVVGEWVPPFECQCP